MHKCTKYFLFLFLVFILSSCTIKVSDSNKDDGGGSNNNGPPPPPTCVYPNFNDTGVVLTPQISWLCNSYNGEPIVFDLFLDTMTPPKLIAADLTDRYYYVYTLLLSNKMYYWQVKSKNEYGSSYSSLSFFTTTSMGPDAGSMFKK